LALAVRVRLTERCRQTAQILFLAQLLPLAVATVALLIQQATLETPVVQAAAVLEMVEALLVALEHQAKAMLAVVVVLVLLIPAQVGVELLRWVGMAQGQRVALAVRVQHLQLQGHLSLMPVVVAVDCSIAVVLAVLVVWAVAALAHRQATEGLELPILAVVVAGLVTTLDHPRVEQAAQEWLLFLRQPQPLQLQVHQQ
jgi:hypothetical protein